MKKQEEESKLAFDKLWSAYKIILDNNYLCHRGMYTTLANFLDENYSKKPFTFLDLGCGDAGFSTDVLKKTPIIEYVGVDSVPAVLELAKSNLASLQCKTQLIEGDFFEKTKSMDEKFDIVLIAYSLHHLPTKEEKQAFLIQCKNLLKENGCFIVIDITRDKGLSRIEWLNLYEQYAANKCKLLSSIQHDEVMSHMKEHDFPEEIETYQALADSVGFKGFSVLKNYDNFFSFMVFSQI